MPINLDLFMDHMRGRGLVEVFLRGHLWVEKFLGDLLECELRDPGAIQLDRMPFSQKVSLAQALGLVCAAEAVSLRHLNRVRNKLAHDLGGDPSDADLKAIEASLSGLHKTMFEAQIRRHPDADKVRRLEFVIHGILICLEYHRLQRIYERENHEVLSTYRLVKALQDRSGLGSNTDEQLRDQYQVPPPPEPYDVWVQGRGIDFDDAGKRIEGPT